MSVYSIWETMNEETLYEAIRQRPGNNHFHTLGGKRRKGGMIRQHHNVEWQRIFSIKSEALDIEKWGYEWISLELYMNQNQELLPMMIFQE